MLRLPLSFLPLFLHLLNHNMDCIATTSARYAPTFAASANISRTVTSTNAILAIRSAVSGRSPPSFTFERGGVRGCPGPHRYTVHFIACVPSGMWRIALGLLLALGHSPRTSRHHRNHKLSRLRSPRTSLLHRNRKLSRLHSPRT